MNTLNAVTRRLLPYPKASHDPWFDKPYEPSASAFPEKKQPEQSVDKPKKQVAALLVRRNANTG